MDTVNTELIRGHVDTIILNAIMERDRYGYEILDIISNLSDGRYEIKQPTLYSCLKRLEKQGFITSYYGDESNGGRRRYYRITDKGRETVIQDQREWEFSRTIINRLLSDKEIDLATVEAPFDASDLRPLTRRVRAYDIEETPADAVMATTAPVNADTEQNAQVINPQPAENVPANNEAVAPVTQNQNVVPTTNINAVESVAPPAPQQIGSEQPAVAVNPIASEVAPVGVQKYSEEEALAIKEKQTAASKMLQIGDYARKINLLSPESSLDDNQNIANTPTPPATPRQAIVPDYMRERTSGDANPSLNYREALSAIYVSKEPTTTLKAVEESDILHEENLTKSKHFSEVKQSLYEDGYKLKVYQKANSTNYYYMKYIYSNRLNRDTAIFTYLVLLVELLVMIIAHKSFGSVTAFIIMALAGLSIPIIPTLIWAGNPTKRVKAKFNPSSSLINALIIFIIISAIAVILSLVVPSLEVDFTKGRAYVPYIIASNIPISVLIYGLLYKSNNYHLKK